MEMEKIVSITTAPSTSPRTPSGAGIYIAFVPWILFSVISERDSLKAASIVALAAALVIAFRSIAARHPKVLELGAVAAFAGFTVAAFVLDGSASDDVVRYARAIAAGLLALIALLSLLRTPFTEQYARETVPRQFWSSPRFTQINRQLSLMWGLVFLAMVPSHIIAGAIDTHRGNLIFNWAIPVALVVYAVKRQTALTEQDDVPVTA
jgi:amino acid permease